MLSTSEWLRIMYGHGRKTTPCYRGNHAGKQKATMEDSAYLIQYKN
jgi:hypothetical protein